MSERGEIRNRDFAKQLRDFRGMRLGNITPTDIDVFFEYKDMLFIITELKHCEEGTLEIKKDGQYLAFTRCIDTLEKGGKKAYLIYCSHLFESADDIQTHECKVEWIYTGKRLFRPLSKWTAKTFQDEVVRRLTL